MVQFWEGGDPKCKRPKPSNNASRATSRKKDQGYVYSTYIP